MQLVDRIGDGLLDGFRLQALTCDDIRDRLGIGSGLEDTALQLEVAAELGGVYQVSVMAECHTALDMIYDDRLRIDTISDTGSRITYMSAGNLTLSETVELILRHRFTDETELTVKTEYTLIIDDDTGRFLSSVL